MGFVICLVSIKLMEGDPWFCVIWERRTFKMASHLREKNFISLMGDGKFWAVFKLFNVDQMEGNSVFVSLEKEEFIHGHAFS